MIDVIKIDDHAYNDDSGEHGKHDETDEHDEA